MNNYFLTVLPIDGLEQPQIFRSAINNRGDVAAWVFSDTQSVPVVWFAGSDTATVVPFDMSGNDGRWVNINDSGEILYSSSTFSCLCRQPHAGAPWEINTIQAEGYDRFESPGLSATGMVTGWAGPGSPFNLHPDEIANGVFIYDAATKSAIGTFCPGIGRAINDQGQVAGIAIGAESDSALPVFLLTRFADPVTNMLKYRKQDLGVASSVWDLNNLGAMVGAHLAEGSTNRTAYVCQTAGGASDFADLGTLPGYLSSEARAINDAGDIVGTCVAATGTSAFVQLNGKGMCDLNTLILDGTDWNIYHADGINNNGQIVGACARGAETRAFILTPSQVLQFNFPVYVSKEHALLVGGTAMVWFGPGTRPVPIDPQPLWQKLSPEMRDLALGVVAKGVASLAATTHEREQIEKQAMDLIWSAIDRLPSPPARAGKKLRR